jgi:iron complex transport system ATP-binding protein
VITVSASALTVRAGGVLLVDSVALSVGRGEWVSVLGPNGAGKTTLLRALAGMAPYSGRIALGGREPRRISRREAARIVALVPQQPLVPAEMTVAEYVLLGRTPHLPYLAQEGARDEAAAAEALDRLELLPFAARRLGSLSGGELQRALIARALAQEAPLLLLDEPTTSLDVGRQQEVLELVDALRRESALTIVSTMHDLTLAAQYGDRVVLLDRGRIVADGLPADVLSEHVVRALYGADVKLVVEGGRLVGIVPLRRRVAG